MSRRRQREVHVEIQTLSPEGLGLGVAHERVIAAKNALPGELVTARVLKRRRGVWHAEARAPDRAATTRVAPPCSYFPRCGGCAMMHLTYEAQLERKERQLADALRAHGVAARHWQAPTTGPRLGYRSKARLGVRVVGGELLAGFRETASNRVVRMDSCQTLLPVFSSLLEPLKQTLATFREPDRVPQVELAAGDSRAAMIVRHLEALSPAELDALARLERDSGVAVFLQHGGYETVRPLEADASPYLGFSNYDFGLHFRFLPWDFTQVNLVMNRALVRSALRGLNAPGGARVLDLFCGIGNFSLAAAALGANVVGLEASDGAVQRARENALLNGLEGRCEFHSVDLYDPGCEVGEACDYMVLDPPRSGAGENLGRWLKTLAPHRVAYVSCSPASFAQDARVLADGGYGLLTVGIFDMFPHTAHVETLGIFERQW